MTGEVFIGIALILMAVVSCILGGAACAWAVALRRLPETRAASRTILRAGAVGAVGALLVFLVQNWENPQPDNPWFVGLSLAYIGFGWASVLTARLMLARTRSHGSSNHINRTEFPPDTPEFRRFFVVSLYVYLAVWFLPIWVSGLYR